MSSTQAGSNGASGAPPVPLRFEVRVGNGSLDAHAPARPAGELARRLGRAIHDRRNLVERHAKDVVQHEREPLRRRA